MGYFLFIRLLAHLRCEINWADCLEAHFDCDQTVSSSFYFCQSIRQNFYRWFPSERTYNSERDGSCEGVVKGGRHKRVMRSSWLTILLLINLLSHVLADQIFAAHAGGTFGRSSHEPKYMIEFRSDESPFHPDEDQESLVMSNKEGQKYLCFLPKVEKTKIGKPVAQENTSNVIVETERRVKWKTPDELLEMLKGECFARHEGWWSYEFCYQKKLRQFHLEDEKPVQEFILGEYDAEATAAFNDNLSDVYTLKDPRSKDASQRYHAHQYTNGTICDLTNQPRETEVRFVCSDSRVMISSITELSTCKYALTVQCPLLCKHPMFQEETPVWHTINCNKLPKDYRDADVDDSFRDKEIPMIADIEVLSHYDSGHYAT